jgi:hypothetical protein
MRAAMKRAYDDDVLAVPQHDINRYVHIVAPPPGIEGARVRAIAGGEKDFKRRSESAQLRRSDGVWFHFTITVAEGRGKALDLLAYTFEVAYPDGHVPEFIRFDLNPPGHPNEAREMRSHMHPGREDLRLPAPVLDPLEALHLMLRMEIVTK